MEWRQLPQPSTCPQPHGHNNSNNNNNHHNAEMEKHGPCILTDSNNRGPRNKTPQGNGNGTDGLGCHASMHLARSRSRCALGPHTSPVPDCPSDNTPTGGPFFQFGLAIRRILSAWRIMARKGASTTDEMSVHVIHVTVRSLSRCLSCSRANLLPGSFLAGTGKTHASTDERYIIAICTLSSGRCIGTLPRD